MIGGAKGTGKTGGLGLPSAPYGCCRKWSITGLKPWGGAPAGFGSAR